MTEDIIPSRRYRATAWVAGITTCFVLTGAGISAAAIRYDSEHRNVVLSGVEIGGVPIGGLPFNEARDRIVRTFIDPLSNPISIEAAGQDFITSARELGVTNNALMRFEQMVSTRDMALVGRIWTRLTGSSVGYKTEVQTTFDEDKVKALVLRVAAAVNRQPRDKQLSFVDGALRISPEAAGFALNEGEAAGAIRLAIRSDHPTVKLSGKTLPPDDRGSAILDVLVVKVGENKLMHYRGEELVKVYDVATGTSGYPTPKGQFKVVLKRFRPTWVNPAKYPGGWGANLPAKIGPGQGNPLGTRALDLSTPGIRIHGTSQVSSLGFNASHGCIRMRMSDVEELFGRVEVGTAVLIVQAGSNRAMPRRLRQTTPEPIAEADATSVPGQPPPPEPSPSPPKEPDLIPL